MVSVIVRQSVHGFLDYLMESNMKVFVFVDDCGHTRAFKPGLVALNALSRDGGFDDFINQVYDYFDDDEENPDISLLGTLLRDGMLDKEHVRMLSESDAESLFELAENLGRYSNFHMIDVEGLT